MKKSKYFFSFVLTPADDGVTVDKFIRENNPPTIKIEDEPEYKVKDWFTTSSKDDGQPDYENSKSGLPNSKTGSNTTTVTLENEENTLHVLLVKNPDPTTPTVQGGELVLMESEISKYVSSMNTSITGWGSRAFMLTCSRPKTGSHGEHYCSDEDCSGHSCTFSLVDSSLNFIADNTATRLAAEAETVTGIDAKFRGRTLNNEWSKSVSGGDLNDTETSAEYQTTIWRVGDVPTEANYTTKQNNTLQTLIKNRGMIPIGTRSANGINTNGSANNRQILIQLEITGTDFSVHSKGSYCGDTDEKTASYNSVNEHKGDITVHTYRGDASKKSTGNKTYNSFINTISSIRGNTTNHSGGYMVQWSNMLQFYPHIRMTYQVTGSSNKVDSYVLSEQLSQILPNDFGEAAWYNEKDDNASLNLTSYQWSIHKRATEGDEWQSHNNVLPGGAIYSLDTNGSNSWVTVSTWQTAIEGEERKALQGLNASDYSIDGAIVEHDKYAEQARQVLEGMRIVQWVNKDWNVTHAWDGSNKVKIKSGGESLAPLGLPNTAATDDKYILKSDGSPDNASKKASDADLDVVSMDKLDTVYYKVYADTSGDFYLAMTNSKDKIIKHTALTPQSNVVVEKLFNKNIGASNVENKLASLTSSLGRKARDINDRTNAIENLARALEYNTGNDPIASWATDGKWYNESFGFIIVNQMTRFEVGLAYPAVRSLALDNTLSPAKYGTTDLFTKAHASQFRCDSYSDAPIAQGKVERYIGSFKGRDIILKDAENLFNSKLFFIPNASVSDLR